MILLALFILAFASTPCLSHLILHHIVTRRPVLQKVRHHARVALCLLVSKRFQVLFHSPPGVLFTVPSRYCSLSVTWSYLALWDGPHVFRQDSSCPDVLRILPAFCKFRLRDFHPLRSAFPKQFGYLGSSDFARHYFRNRFYFLFLRVLRCFSSPGSPRNTMDSCRGHAILLHGVPSFGYLRISEYLLLPAAFRSLSRPSSAPCT